MNKLVFTCGATIDCADPTPQPVGSKVAVYASGQKLSRTVPTDESLRLMDLNIKGDPALMRMNCLLMCPMKVKDSGRKVQEVVFEDNKRGYLVTCKVRMIN